MYTMHLNYIYTYTPFHFLLDTLHVSFSTLCPPSPHSFLLVFFRSNTLSPKLVLPKHTKVWSRPLDHGQFTYQGIHSWRKCILPPTCAHQQPSTGNNCAVRSRPSWSLSPSLLYVDWLDLTNLCCIPEFSDEAEEIWWTSRLLVPNRKYGL